MLRIDIESHSLVTFPSSKIHLPNLMFVLINKIYLHHLITVI